MSSNACSLGPAAFEDEPDDESDVSSSQSEADESEEDFCEARKCHVDPFDMISYAWGP